MRGRPFAIVDAALAVALVVAAIVSWVNPDLIARGGMTWGAWISLALVGPGLAISLSFDSALLWDREVHGAARTALLVKWALILATVLLWIADSIRLANVTASIGETTGPLLLPFVAIWAALMVASVTATVLIVRIEPADPPTTDAR